MISETAYHCALTLYRRASNAKVNLSKTIAFPMARSADPQLKDHLTALDLQWHDSTSHDALIYLGFPIFFGKHQEKTLGQDLRQNQSRTRHSLFSHPISPRQDYHCQRPHPVPPLAPRVGGSLSHPVPIQSSADCYFVCLQLQADSGMEHYHHTTSQGWTRCN